MHIESVVVTVVLNGHDDHHEGKNKQHEEYVVYETDDSEKLLGKQVKRHENVCENDQKNPDDPQRSQKIKPELRSEKVFPQVFEHIGKLLQPAQQRSIVVKPQIVLSDSLLQIDGLVTVGKQFEQKVDPFPAQRTLDLFFIMAVEGQNTLGAEGVSAS